MAKSTKSVKETTAAAIATEEVKDTTVVAEETVPVEAAAPATSAAPAPLNDELADKIKAYGGDDAVVAAIKDLGAVSVSDLLVLTEKDLTDAGLKLVPARNLLKDLQETTKPATPATPVAAAAPMIAPVDYSSVLPDAPNDESLLNSLRTGGVLKVGDSTYVSAIRAILGDSCGLFDIPDRLAKAMEAFANESDEPVPASYYKIKENVTRRNYSEIFAAIDGLNGNYVTATRKKEFIKRMWTEFFPELVSAYNILNKWYDEMLAVGNNPATIASTLAGALNGTGAAMAAANMPSTNPVRDACLTLRDKINHCFRGTITPVAAAMAYDGIEIVKMLNDSTMPAMIGAPNRDAMLKKLEIKITPNYTRLEQNLVRFALSYVKFDDMGAENEIPYLTAMWQLGHQINWEELCKGAQREGVVTGLTGKQIL